jgi:8-oxo-(d)GTP phosphatase
MGDREAAEEVRAAGAVVWRPAGSGAQIALVHRPKYDDWSFPKGKLEPAEHVLLAAVREVAEETGLSVTLGHRLPSVSYWNDEVRKRVDYWVATAASNTAPFEPNSEIDEFTWLPMKRAAARLSYERDAATLDTFRAGPRQTVPLILVRHAPAGSKTGWPGSDTSRPLDGRGEADAEALASLLRCFGTGRVVSAPAERCVATVRPYANSFGGVIEIEASFEIPLGGKADRDAADRDAAGTAGAAAGTAAAMARLAADNRPVVVSAHRENLPALLEAACAALGAPTPDIRPLRKGEFYVLHRAGGTLAALERYHPDGQSLVVYSGGATGIEAAFGFGSDEPAPESGALPRLPALAGAGAGTLGASCDLVGRLPLRH